MANPWKKRIAIVGIGETKVGEVPDQTAMELHVEAAKLAMDDAGLRKDDVDGVLTAGSNTDPHLLFNMAFSEHIGIYPRFSLMCEIGQATWVSMVLEAAGAISAGLAETVLIVSGDSMLSGLGRGGAMQFRTALAHSEFELPFGPTVPSIYAFAATRHMHQYGTRPEHLAQLAASARKHASANPRAQMQKPITVDDVLNSRLIASPLHLLDCSVVSDGGGALIVTSEERARDLRKRPIFVLGGGSGHTHHYISSMPDLTTTGAVSSGKTAFQMTGLRPEDMDFAEISDPFTITPLVILEDLGFCGKGEGGPFVEGGSRIEVGGQLPLNTHGGCLSHCHPGIPAGLFHILEAVRQLRGEVEGERQVKDAGLGLVHGSGGMMSTHATMILGKE